MKYLHYHDADTAEAELARRAQARDYLKAKAAQRRRHHCQMALTLILLIILAAVVWWLWL